MVTCRGVLGDRSLGEPWGGSVLDSVIGAYLTQVCLLFYKRTSPVDSVRRVSSLDLTRCGHPALSAESNGSVHCQKHLLSCCRRAAERHGLGLVEGFHAAGGTLPSGQALCSCYCSFRPSYARCVS